MADSTTLVAPVASASPSAAAPSATVSAASEIPISETASARRSFSPAALKRFAPRIRPYTGKIVLALVCLLISSTTVLAFPQIVRHLLDAAFISGDQGMLNSLALALLVLFGVQACLTAVQVYLLTSVSERVVAKLRTDLFSHLIYLSPGFFSDRRTGELTSRLSSDSTLLQTVVATNISEFTRQTLLLIGGLVLLTITHPVLAATTLAVVPITVGAAFVFGKALRRASTGVQDYIAEANGTADEAFAQIRTVQGFTSEDEEIRKYSTSLTNVIQTAIRRSKIRGLFFGVLTFCGFGGVVVVLWQGGRLVLSGALTAGALVSFLLYAMFVAGAVASLGSLFGAYQEAVGAAKRIFELLDTEPDVRESLTPVALPRPVRGDVRLDRVTFRYGETQPDVLHEISFHIAPGEVVALVGPSGAGKTTISSLIPRFWDVTNGRILLDGIDVRNLSMQTLRSSIGIVPQEPTLFSGSIRENIAYAVAGENRQVTHADIEAAARAANAHEFIERLPKGYDTEVGERGVKLSGGQRQRLAIARVFLKNPAFVILDEATSSLDSESERYIEAAMEELLRDRSTLIIAHRLSTVLRADRLVVLERGHLVEEGSHTQLLANEGTYAKLYRGQFRAADMASLELI